MFIAFFILLVLLTNFLVYHWSYQLGLQQSQQQSDYQRYQFKQQLIQQQQILNNIKKSYQTHLDVMAVKLVEIQSRILRLDVLGKTFADSIGLQAQEFDFSTVPGQGGLTDNAQNALNTLEVNQLIQTVQQRLWQQEQQFQGLDLWLKNDQLQQSMIPSAWPVKEGWISSDYGYRIHPLTGRRAFHKGIDFAATKGSNIYAVASGIIRWQGKHKEYGDMIEIDHGNGFITRYCHNQKNLVKIGQIVKKGDVIGFVGSTGRSTGAHVHFEMLYKGKLLNPKQYLKKLVAGAG